MALYVTSNYISDPIDPARYFLGNESQDIFYSISYAPEVIVMRSPGNFQFSFFFLLISFLSLHSASSSFRLFLTFLRLAFSACSVFVLNILSFFFLLCFIFLPISFSKIRPFELALLFCILQTLHSILSIYPNIYLLNTFCRHHYKETFGHGDKGKSIKNFKCPRFY